MSLTNWCCDKNRALVYERELTSKSTNSKDIRHRFGEQGPAYKSFHESQKRECYEYFQRLTILASLHGIRFLSMSVQVQSQGHPFVKL